MIRPAKPYWASDQYYEHCQLIMMVTRACQLDCVYCGYDRTLPSMTRETLRASVDLLMTARAPLVKLQFFGGEPLLRLDLVREGLDYAEAAAAKAGKTVAFMITTNTMSLTDALRAELDARKVTWILSFDGGADAQDEQRPLRAGGSKYGSALEQIVRIAKSGAPYLVNMTVSAERAHVVDENAWLLISAGVHSLSVSYRMGDRWPPERSRAYFQSLSRLLRRVHLEGIGLSMLNAVGRDEPNIISPMPTVDCDGMVYVGAVVPSLERLMPTLAPVMRRGYAADIKDFESIRSDRMTVQRLALGAAQGTPDEGPLLDAFRMGKMSQSFFDGMVELGLLKAEGRRPPGEVLRA
jgi:hypothetical protein